MLYSLFTEGFHTSSARALDGVEQVNEAYHLNKIWPILVEIGYKFDPKIFEKRVRRLKEIQLEDGGWRFYWSQESDPHYTTVLLINLVRAEIISKVDLRKAMRNLIDKGGVVR